MRWNRRRQDSRRMHFLDLKDSSISSGTSFFLLFYVPVEEDRLSPLSRKSHGRLYNSWLWPAGPSRERKRDHPLIAINDRKCFLLHSWWQSQECPPSMSQESLMSVSISVWPLSWGSVLRTLMATLIMLTPSTLGKETVCGTKISLLIMIEHDHVLSSIIIFTKEKWLLVPPFPFFPSSWKGSFFSVGISLCLSIMANIRKSRISFH